MKKIFYLFAYLPLLANAQSLLNDNKVWNVDVYAHFDHTYDHSRAYILDGDTIVGEQQAKKLYLQKKEGAEPEYLMAMYEDEGKVWFAREETTEWILAYDFGLEVGEEAVIESLESYGKYKVKVLSAEQQEIKGVGRKTMVVETESLENQDAKPYEAIWVEGIGCTFGLQKNCGYDVPVGMIEYRFTGCSDDGEIILDWDDICKLSGLITNIDKVQMPSQSTTSSFDLQGRKLKEEPQQGMFIRDGRVINK